jgi:hypothetical protein
VPPQRAGSKRHRDTAATAARSSSGSPEDARTSTRPTVPSALTRSLTCTRPWRPTAEAEGNPPGGSTVTLGPGCSGRGAYRGVGGARVGRPVGGDSAPGSCGPDLSGGGSPAAAPSPSCPACGVGPALPEGPPAPPSAGPGRVPPWPVPGESPKGGGSLEGARRAASRGLPPALPCTVTPGDPEAVLWASDCGALSAVPGAAFAGPEVLRLPGEAAGLSRCRWRLRPSRAACAGVGVRTPVSPSSSAVGPLRASCRAATGGGAGGWGRQAHTATRTRATAASQTPRTPGHLRLATCTNSVRPGAG